MAISTFLKNSFLVCLLAVNSYAFDWNIFKYNLGFNMFIMDHEGSTPYWVNTNTNLKTRLTPNFGIQFYTKGVEQSLTVGAYFFKTSITTALIFPTAGGLLCIIRLGGSVLLLWRDFSQEKPLRKVWFEYFCPLLLVYRSKR